MVPKIEQSFDDVICFVLPNFAHSISGKTKRFSTLSWNPRITSMTVTKQNASVCGNYIDFIPV